jgi:hypothetical protein
MAVKPAKSAKASNSTFVTPQVAAAQDEQKHWNAPRRVLVQNGKVIEPASDETLPGRRSPSEVFIAVADEEVELLTEALATGAKIICLSRSALPGASDSPLPEPEVAEPPQVIQVISGSTSSVAVVPAAGDDDLMADETAGLIDETAGVGDAGDRSDPKHAAEPVEGSDPERDAWLREH